MPDTLFLPDECRTMDDVRSGINALDAELIALLGRRFGYMRAAARIKPNRGAVRDEARKAEVIGNAVMLAQAQGIPVDLIGRLWEQLVEGCIAYELGEWDRTRG